MKYINTILYDIELRLHINTYLYTLYETAWDLNMVRRQEVERD